MFGLSAYALIFGVRTSNWPSTEGAEGGGWACAKPTERRGVCAGCVPRVCAGAGMHGADRSDDLNPKP
jgi:hypothetical protein